MIFVVLDPGERVQTLYRLGQRAGVIGEGMRLTDWKGFVKRQA
jgi:hypothetical protein